MNAPFPTPGGSDPSSPDEPGLRSLLEAEARRQPPVSSADLRAGVDRRLRRRRVQMAAVVVPVVALVLVGAALLAPRSNPDATLDTAAQTTGQDGPDEAAPAEPPATTQVDCGSVSLGPDRVDPETGPMDCFIEAFNGGTDARLVVVTEGPDGGTLTQTVTTAADGHLAVAAEGTLSVQLPNLGFGGGGGLVQPEADGPGTDCGTITITEDSAHDALSSEVTTCMARLFTSGSGGGVTLVAQDAFGGTMTLRVDLSADALLTVTVDGQLTQAVPEGLTIPSDLTSKLPPNGFGLDDLGLGDGNLFPGGEPHN